MPIRCLQTCLECGRSGWYRTPLCTSCKQQLPTLTRHCEQCSLPLHHPSKLCGRCLQKSPSFDSTLAAFTYQDRIKQMILNLKYQQQCYQAHWLADLWWQQCQQRIQTVDIILPIPLHARRLRQRGYNQAALLAQQLAKHSGSPCDIHALKKIKFTQPQSELKARQRQHLPANAFSTGNLCGKSIAVVDDVMTTGSTLQAVAHCLKQHGAKTITNWVIARAIFH